MTGLFITMEGPDGAGKTSVLAELAPMLTAVSKRPIVETREPGGIDIAEQIRRVILDPKNTLMDERTEALLYAAARRQHLVQKIIPALEADKIVLCDRFVDSSLAYQGAGRKLGMAEVAEINKFATEGIEPNLTLYLDVDADTGLARIQKNRTYHDRLDAEAPEFHQRVRHAYLKIVAENPERIVLIDARAPIEEVVKNCFRIVVEHFPDYFENNLNKL